ncbi:MAG: type IX secretion system protein PorQ [Flavobacterium sp.]
MFKKIVCIVFFFAGLIGYSQVGGKSVYQFLNLVTSPRQAALGGKVITFYDNDVNQAHFNPACINSEMDNRLSLNYGSYFGEVTYGTASYAYTNDRRQQTFFGGVNYVNYGEFEGYDEEGQKTASFTGSDVAVSLGYAYNIPGSDFYFGANTKFISSTLESYNSMGIALDLGAIYVNPEKRINWALSLRNIGAEIKPYAETREKLPFEIIAGVSQQMENAPVRWHVTMENLQQWKVGFSNPNRAESSLDGTVTEENVSFFNNALRHFIVGAELFPEKGFNIRLGYNFRRGEELKVAEQRHFSGLSLGFGLRIKKLKFNYSYSRYTLAANTSLFGLTINFSENQ